MNIRDVYEWFFREGGYRLMRLLVIKAEYEPGRYRAEFDVVALMRLKQCGEEPAAGVRARAVREIDYISEIFELQRALKEVMDGLPWDWGETIEIYYGHGLKQKNGTLIRKRTAENALAGVCKAIQNQKGWYDFATEGLQTVFKLMSYLERAARTGGCLPESLLMKAATCMKLFRNSENGILYTDALREFCVKTALSGWTDDGWGDADELEHAFMIREEITDGQQRSGLECKVSEDRSSVLIDRMYEVYSIMWSVRQYLPEKYERMMLFHWTKHEERLRDLFLEVAAMLVAAEERMQKQAERESEYKQRLILQNW